MERGARHGVSSFAGKLLAAVGCWERRGQFSLQSQPLVDDMSHIKNIWATQNGSRSGGDKDSSWIIFSNKIDLERKGRSGKNWENEGD